MRAVRRLAVLRGYTMIEMMITVAIVGILAAVAIPTYSVYRRRAKTAEVPEHLSALFLGASTYFKTPITVSTGAGLTIVDKCATGQSATLPSTFGADPQRANFQTDAAFLAVNFSVATPLFYGYQIDGVNECGINTRADVYTFHAFGDLDGDTEISMYELTAGALGSGDLYRSQGIFSIDEYE
jgi:prepilin-type N-terminal cleavage/methylation domain-containing protein